MMIKFLATLLSSILVAGCSHEIPGQTRLPRCEARSNVDPARLSIDARAKDFGAINPCRAEIRFSISRNTDLRTMEGRVELTDVHGALVASESFELEFSSPSAGMFRKTVVLSPIDEYICRDLLVELSGILCRNGKGEAIECPAVRLKSSYVFEDFTIDDTDLNVCFD